MSLMSGIVNSGSIPMIEAVLRFTEARQRVIANNVANAATPYYRARDVDVRAFERSLAKAVSARKSGEPLKLASSRNVRTEGGRLELRPVRRPGGDPLRHDMNNVSIETEQGILYKNAMTARVMTRLLRGRYEMLRSAVSGRVR